MTLSDLLTNLYRRLNYADTPDTSVTTRLTMFLNERHRRLLTTMGLRETRTGFGTLTSVSGQAEYGLPYGVTRLLTVRDRTNDRTLAVMAWETYRALNPDPTTTSTPDSVVPLGIRAVFRRPGAQGVWAVSTSAGDTQNALFVGNLSSSTPRGRLLSTTTALTGTSRVRLGGANTYDDVETVSLATAAAGDVTLYDAASGGNVLGVIPAGRRTARTFVIALHPTPGSVLDYDLDYEQAVLDLSNTWDEPLVPEDFHDLLVLGALQDEFLHRDDTRYSTAKAEYDGRLREFKAWTYNHRAATAPQPPRELAPLGPWYPFQRP